MNFLEKKAQIGLASDGVELLKNKRDALVKEFFSVVKDFFSSRELLETATGKAAQSLSLARGLDGKAMLYSASLATTHAQSIEVKRQNIWGIRINKIESKPFSKASLARGYSLLTTSQRIERTAQDFEEVMNLIMKMAVHETMVKKIGEEIKKTTRRVNALEQIVIPSLQNQTKYIESTLEEREREDLLRLKHLKKTKEKGGGKS